jgi:hypothetical protein
LRQDHPAGAAGAGRRPSRDCPQSLIPPVAAATRPTIPSAIATLESKTDTTTTTRGKVPIARRVELKSEWQRAGDATSSEGGAVDKLDRPRSWRACCGLAALLCGSAYAHHSLTAEFDTRKILTLTGVVSRVQWVNPHIYVDLDVEETGDKGATWHLECVPVAMARKAGVSMKMLMGTGEKVTVEAFPARDGTAHLGFLAKISYPDGHHFQFAQDTLAAGAK